MPVSVFTAGYNQCNESTRDSVLNNINSTASVQIGDGTKFIEADDRHSTIQTWDLSDPDTGSLPVLDGSTINSVRMQFTPSATQGAVGLNASHALAVLASDGHWDRSSTNELHQNQSGVTYSAPSMDTAFYFRSYSTGDLVNPTGETSTQDTAPLVGNYDSSASLLYHAFGTTMQVQAGRDVARISIRMAARNPTPPGDTNLKVNVYSLRKNGRHYAVESLIGSSDTIAYSSIAYAANATLYYDFDFSTPISSSVSARWLGFVVEGDWFDESLRASYGMNVARRTFNGDFNNYMDGSFGSAITASKHALSVASTNSLLYFYQNQIDVPAIYGDLNITPSTTPFTRFHGSVMGGDVGLGAWQIDVPRSYGSPGSGADEEFALLAANMQSYLDSTDFGSNRRWFGLMLDIPRPNLAFWDYYGSGDARAVSLIVDWTEGQVGKVCSFGIDASRAVESSGSEITRSVGQHGVDVSPAVSSSIEVEEC
jgi:hypothetical protein